MSVRLNDSLSKSKAIEVANLLRKVMKARGLSQVDIENQSGVSHSVISLLLVESFLTEKTLKKIKIWAAKLPKLENKK